MKFFCKKRPHSFLTCVSQCIKKDERGIPSLLKFFKFLVFTLNGRGKNTAAVKGLRHFGVQHHRQSLKSNYYLVTGFVTINKIVCYQHLLVLFQELLSVRLSDPFTLVVGWINNNWLYFWSYNPFLLFALHRTLREWTWGSMVAVTELHVVSKLLVSLLLCSVVTFCCSRKICESYGSSDVNAP